jgi:threonine dehydrogenase-like Zn-dependent dehydrogenase
MTADMGDSSSWRSRPDRSSGPTGWPSGAELHNFGPGQARPHRPAARGPAARPGGGRLREQERSRRYDGELLDGQGAELCQIQRGDVIAVWGCGPVGQFATTTARLLGAERVIAIDRFPYRLRPAREWAGATETINYVESDVFETLMDLTGGRGPDACIDAVGLESHAPGLEYTYDRAKQALMLETDRPLALREAIRACRNGGIVSIVGVYGGFIDKFPIGSLMNRSLTIRTGQAHVHRYAL